METMIRTGTEGIVKKAMEQGSSFSAVYQTSQTLELDKMFGLTGEPVDNKKIRILQEPAFWIGGTEQETCMPFFALVAGKAGNFYGLPLEEIEKVSQNRVRRSDAISSVREGYLEQFVYNGVTIVSPTTKYQPFDNSPRR